MKTIFLFLFLIVLTAGCESEKDISPAEIWSAGCATFAPYEKEYRLSGMCCQYLVVPKIKIKKDNTFSAAAKLYTYNGSGFEDFSVTLNGRLSEDRESLDLNYRINGTTESFALKPGGATASCYCGCD